MPGPPGVGDAVGVAVSVGVGEEPGVAVKVDVAVGVGVSGSPITSISSGPAMLLPSSDSYPRHEASAWA